MSRLLTLPLTLPLTLLLTLLLTLPLALPTPLPAQETSRDASRLLDAREVHLADLVQLTFGGENAEAYWSPDGKELIYQAAFGPWACDQIFRLPVAVGEDGTPPEPTLVSTGKGRTTCSYFTYPEATRILYSSTHFASPDCPPVPDRSQGYVWAIYDSYEIVSAAPDGSDPRRLTDNAAYDAEATVCPLDGSVIFTSTRDGDLDLYRMDADGSNVRRLTDTPGYDGGAFFSQDCSRIVWRASRHREGAELDDYRRLLAQGLVRPSKLEIWVAEADGTNARQVTYLDAASFAPYFFPGGERILFSSNYGDPRGREFDLWAVDVDGTDLERITCSADFDGFPMFSPDGKTLVFASNRGGEKRGDTNLFLARWVDGPPAGEPSAGDAAGADEERSPDRYQADVAWLADDARDGRGIGTPGLDEAAEWLAESFREIGLGPAGVTVGGTNGEGGERTWRQSFQVPYAVEVGEGTALLLDGAAVPAEEFRPAAFSAAVAAAAEVIPVGYGITAPEHGIDDYADLDVAGKIVAVRRFVPAGEPFTDTDAERRYSDLRYKVFNAREHGAVGVLVVDLPLVAEGAPEASPPPADPAHGSAEGSTGSPAAQPDEAPLPALAVDQPGDAGLPVAVLTRAAGAKLFAGGIRAELRVDLVRQMKPADNVLGLLPAGAPEAERLPGAILLGAHYDHLGFGGRGSLDPDSHAPHNGADDNASGTAALLEAARTLVARQGELRRDVWFVAFSGEESGILGSTHLTREPVAGLDLSGMVAMINMDMVGRLRNNRLSVLGGDSAEEWAEIVDPACAEAGLLCQLGGDGYGPSDQTPFYAAGVPVLHLFTGVHDDYHRPSDDTGKINAAGGARVARLAADLALRLAARPEPLTYKAVPAPPPAGDVRSFGASLGTIPDYAGAGEGKKGVPLSGVRPGSPAEEAGMQRGDVLVELGGHEIGDIYDFVFILRQAKPGDKATAVVERDGRRIEMVITYGVSRGIR